MGAMVPPNRKSCYNFRVVEINRVLDGDTIDVTIDLGFDLFKKERVRIAGVDTPEKRTRDLEEKKLGYDATNWLKEKFKNVQSKAVKKFLGVYPFYSIIGLITTIFMLFKSKSFLS